MTETASTALSSASQPEIITRAERRRILEDLRSARLHILAQLDWVEALASGHWRQSNDHQERALHLKAEAARLDKRARELAAELEANRSQAFLKRGDQT